MKLRREPFPNAVPKRWALGDHFIPRGRYIDPDFARLELDRLFSNTWQVACRDEDIPERGSFYEATIGDKSIVVVRQPDRSVRAVHNFCARHSGQLVRGTGRLERFTCAPHGCFFSLDGTPLTGDSLRAESNTHLHRRELSPVCVDTWGGWIFVHLASSEPVSLREWLPLQISYLELFQLEDMRYRWRKQIEVAANWKVALETFFESFRRTLGSSTRSAPSRKARTHAYGEHVAFHTADSLLGEDGSLSTMASTPTQVADRVERIARDLDALYSASDLDAAHLLRSTEPPAELPALLQFLVFAEHSAIEYGIDYPTVSIGEYITFAAGYHLFPAMVLVVEKSSALGAVVRPLGADPDASIVELFCIEHHIPGSSRLAPLEVLEGAQDPRLGPQLSEWIQTMVSVQRRMHSPEFDAIPLHESDYATMHQHHVADNLLFDVEVRADHFGAAGNTTQSMNN